MLALPFCFSGIWTEQHSSHYCIIFPLWHFVFIRYWIFGSKVFLSDEFRIKGVIIKLQLNLWIDLIGSGMNFIQSERSKSSYHGIEHFIMIILVDKLHSSVSGNDCLKRYSQVLQQCSREAVLGRRLPLHLVTRTNVTCWTIARLIDDYSQWQSTLHRMVC